MNTISFKTSVQNKYDLISIRPIMDIIFGQKNWSLMFEDVNKVLRVVSSVPCATLVKHILTAEGFYCEELS